MRSGKFSQKTYSRLRLRHGDWVMRVRFWSENTREDADRCARCFLRAPVAPKSGRITQSPCVKVFLSRMRHAYTTLSRISTAKKPKADNNAHFRMIQP